MIGNVNPIFINLGKVDKFGTLVGKFTKKNMEYQFLNNTICGMWKIVAWGVSCNFGNSLSPPKTLSSILSFL